MIRTMKMLVTIAALGMVLGSAPGQLFAQDPAPPAAPAEGAAPPAEGGGDQLPGVDGGGGATRGANRPSLDPFKALIEQKVEQPAPTAITPVIAPPAPPPPPIPPVNFKVNAVAGDHPNYVAVIEFEGQTYIVQKGTKVPEEGNAAFEVKEVTAEKVTVFDMKINRLVPKQLVTDNN
jgi:hypothetical protein